MKWDRDNIIAAIVVGVCFLAVVFNVVTIFGGE